MLKKIFFILNLIVICLNSSIADEGMWMPSQFGKLPWAEFRQMGMELSIDQVYSESLPSLKDGIVLLGDGTGSFVSDKGLILTNYHVVLAALQAASSKDHDYIRTGYTARKPEEEVPVTGFTAKILLSTKEVTSEVLSVVTSTMTDVERVKAIKTKIAEIEAREKGTSDHECKVSEIYFGLKYFLSTYEVVRDIRLVLSPPKSIGAFGGEEDNWMWPRHTGDFAFMRAYVAPDGKATTYSMMNVPYNPKTFFPLSAQGYREGMFTFVLGYPNLTLRHMASPGIQAAKDVTLPYLKELTDKQLEILRKAVQESPANGVNYSNSVQTLANTAKYIDGMLRSIKKKNVVGIRQNEELELWDHIFADSILGKSHGTVFVELDTAYLRYREYSKKQIVCTQLINNIQLLRIATVFKDYANSFQEGEKPNPNYKNNLKNFYTMSLRSCDVEVDKQMFTSLLTEAAKLPDDQQISVVKKIIGHKKYKELEKAIKSFIDKLYKSSKVAKKESCDKLLELKPKQIMSEEFVVFATGLDKEYKQVQADLATLDAKLTRLLRMYEEVKLSVQGSEPYPDANRTLRMSYGTVKSYMPRNSVYYNYFTTLSGVYEKESVEEDAFLVSPKLHKLIVERNLGSYVDTTVNDIPVAFITNTDNSGGNSGSPMLNGKGEIIGISFDGNWEGMAGDYMYQENLNRTINVDCRYILFYLEKFTEATDLLQELTVKR